MTCISRTWIDGTSLAIPTAMLQPSNPETDLHSGKSCNCAPSLVDRLSTLVFGERLSDIEFGWLFLLGLVSLLVLGAITVSDDWSCSGQSHVKRAKRDMEEIQWRIKIYDARHGHLPDSLEPLVDGEILLEYPVDQWGTDYQAFPRHDGKGFVLRSAGPDCIGGTLDDIY